ncbi:MAG: anaerobic ribonucleoside-triphosphate reductase activating protein [Ruminococcaceae bacterium]|nr:anaerobic ribonucleoside-triphosphate reductase activating protein [Oscillospiraceae bacterium]
MNIQGLQKLTLLDYPEHVACTVFTGGCNFRCPFCHNALLVTGNFGASKMTSGDIFGFLKKRQGILDGVCITGGEPLLHPDINELLRGIKDLGFAVKLDTNGSFPEKLIELCENGLVDYVAMDIKNTPEKYGVTVGKADFDITPILKSVEFLKKGTVPYEFRTTVTLEYHEIEDIENISKWLKGAEKYFLQNFVDSGELIDSETHGHDKNVMKSMLEVAKRYLPSTELRGI